MIARVGLALLAAAAASLLLATDAPFAADAARLPQVDEAIDDVSWQRFRTRLIDAASGRDQKTLIGFIDPTIRNISGRNGLVEFRRIWNPQAADSPLWTELPRLLFLGGAYLKRDGSQTELCAPYVRFRWPDDRPFDGFGAIVTKDALLKAKPAATAATLAGLNYDLVAVLDWEIADENPNGRQKWVRVGLGTLSGYVPEEHVRSPLEHYACFAKTGNRWRMTAFGVGHR